MRESRFLNEQSIEVPSPMTKGKHSSLSSKKRSTSKHSSSSLKDKIGEIIMMNKSLSQKPTSDLKSPQRVRQGSRRMKTLKNMKSIPEIS